MYVYIRHGCECMSTLDTAADGAYFIIYINAGFLGNGLILIFPLKSRLLNGATIGDANLVSRHVGFMHMVP